MKFEPLNDSLKTKTFFRVEKVVILVNKSIEF